MVMLGGFPSTPLELHVEQDLQDGLGPVAAVGEQAKVREGLLRRACLTLDLRQLIACNETTACVKGHHYN